jgi:ribosomal protein S27E
MSRFVKAKCTCGSSQVFFGDAKSEVDCNSCGNVLATPQGGRARIAGDIEEILG